MFTIENTTSGHILGTYEGRTPEAAYVAMLEDAGELTNALRLLSSEAEAGLDAEQVRLCGAALNGRRSAVLACGRALLAGNPALRVTRVVR